MKRTLTNLIYVASILFLAWIVISWIDIISDNLTDHYRVEAWNFFSIVFGG